MFLFENFFAFCFRFSFYQFVIVPEDRINIVLGLSFAGVWWIKLAVLFDGF